MSEIGSVRAARFAAILIAALALTFFATGAAAGASSLPANSVGVNALLLFGAPQWTWASHLNQMQQGGIAFVRSDADWSWAEPNPPSGGVHAYEWSVFDSVVAALAQHGMTWFPIVDYSAAWAAAQPGNRLSPPSSDSTFATYAAALAKRYGAAGEFWRMHPDLPYHPVEQWEIWNEENGGYFWQPSPDPSAYIDLYLAARSAIRAVDPTARAVVGGLTGNATTNTFIDGMYRHRPDARGQVDAIGLHPYPQDSAETAGSSLQLISSVRTHLNYLGDQNVPIEITEAGWTTLGIGALSDAARAAQMTQLLMGIAGSNLGVSLFMPYTWVTDQTTDGWGMFHWDGTPTLEGSAFLAALKALGAAPVATPPSAPPTPTASAPVSPGSVAVSPPRLERPRTVHFTITCPSSRSTCAGISQTRFAARAAASLATSRRSLIRRFSLTGGSSATFQLRVPARLRRLAARRHLWISVSLTDHATPAGASATGRVVALI